MALYHLDPRQAGTGAAPDVETINEGTIGWTAFRIYADGSHAHALLTNRPDEQAALRAAREAAGFGHVAERPCDCHRRTGCCTVCGQYTDFQSHSPCKASMQDPRQECTQCAWPRAAHGKEA